MSDSILEAFKTDNYRMGDCQIIEYDRKRVDVFGTNYLHYLYSQCLLSRPASPWGILPETFCGMADLSADAIMFYLANRKISLLCVHDSPTQFTAAGFAWMTELIKSPAKSSAFCAFAFFRDFWGTPEQTVLGMLGLSYLFVSNQLTAIHGQRYATNSLAARFMQQFGAKDCGTVPYMLRTHKGELEACTVSTLLRSDFESYVRRQLITLAGASVDGKRVIEQSQRRESPSPAGDVGQ
jgi:hypothetical protein